MKPDQKTVAPQRVRESREANLGQKVLVVDDDWSIRELLRNVLIVYGFDARLAKDAEEFRQIAFQEKLDAIILDLMLANDDGMDVYNRLIKDGLDSTLPVIFISALAEDRPPTFPAKNHKFALIGKPFDPAKLVQALSDILKQ